MGFSSLTQRLVSFNRRKQGRERLARRRIEQFVTTETLETRMLLTGAPPVISDLRLVNDTGIANDKITADPHVQGVLIDPDSSGYDYLVEIDLDSDQVFDRTIYVTPGSTFQFDPSLDLPYGNVSLTFRGGEYSFDTMDYVYGPSETFSFIYRNPNDVAVNQAPTVSLANLPLAAIPENQDFTNDYKIADIIVTDDGLGENLISLDGIDAAKFKVSGGSLYLKAGSRLDYETSHVLQVTVNVDDPSIGTGVDASAVVFIAVGDVNEAPSLLLSNVVTTLEENADTTSPLKVADIAILDDALGNNVLTLGGSDAGLFRIMDAGLYIRQGVSLDYESFRTLNVTVKVDDLSIGTDFEDSQTLSIALTDVNEAPTAVLQNITVTSFPENTPFATPFKIADIAILDDATGQNTLSLNGADADLFKIIDGGLYIKAGASLDYETHPQLSVSVLASDPDAVGTDQAAYATFNVTDVAVAALPDQLTIYNDNRGTGIDLDVLSNDFSDVGTLRIVQTGAVAHGDLAIVSRNQGVENFLRYTPRLGFTGTDSFSYVTTAGGVSSLTTVTLHVLASLDANRAPTVANLNVTALSGQAVSFQPFDRVQDLDGDVIHLIGTPSAAHGTVRVETTAANKTLFFYTPDNGFQGTDTFTYTVADPYGYESSANVTVNVSRPETQTVKDRYQVVSGTVLNANSTSPAAPARSVLTNDLVSGGAAVSAILVSDSAHGTLSFNPDGTFAYTPTTGYVGTDSFSYSLYDGIANTAPQTVDLVVNAEGTQVGPNGNIKLTDSGTANGAFNSNLGVTVQDGQFAIDPTSTYHPGNLVTSSNSLSTSDITTETSTDSGGVSTTTVTTVGLDKSHFAVVDENGYWSYLEFYTIPFDVTTTVTGVSSTHVFGSYSYTFHAWGDNTYSAFSFTTTNITNASGTYVNAPDGSQATSITYIWSDYVFATQTTTNITYFDTGVSLGSVNGFTHEDLSYTGLGPYSYAIDGGTVHGTFSNSGFETSHASTISSLSLSEDGWVGQGIGTAGTIVADFSSAKGSGGFHLSSTNANGLTSTTDGTLTESDDEVAISSAGAIYGLTSTGWALASGAGNSLGIGDFRESSIATGTYSYPVPGGGMIGATSATSHDNSHYETSTIAHVLAGAWQTSGSATTTDSGDTTDSYSGSGSFTNSSSADDGSQTATVTGNISEGGYEESNYFQRAEFFLDNANWVFSSGHGTGGGSGASNATVSQTGHYFNSFADGNITGTTRSNSTSSDGYSYGSTTDSLNVNGTIVDSGTSNSTSWGNSTANAFDSGDYYRNFTATDGTNFVTGGNVTVKSSDRMTYDSGTTSVLLDGVWVQVSGNGTTTGDGDSSNIRSEAGDYTKPLTGGQITGRVGEESSQKSAYDFRIDSTFASGNWSDSGYQNTSGSSFYNSNYSGSGSTVVVSNITNNGTSTITSNVVEDGFDTSNGSWASRSELNPATGWTLASGNEKYRGSGGSNLTSNGSGSYTFPVPGGNVSGNTAQSSGDYSSYSFEITANVVSGVWVAAGTRNETFNAYSSSKSSGQGNSTTADSIEANNTATVHRAWSHNSTENSSMSGFANSSWLDGAWSLSGGTSNSSGNGSSHLESNGTGNYSRAVDGCGTLSGNLTVFSSNDSTWNSNSKGNVANGIWVYSGSSSDSANSTTNRTLNGTGQYAFNNETFTQNGTVTEYTFDSETSDTSGTGNQSSDGTWAQASGDSLATSCGISQLTYTNSVIVRNANLTVGNNTFTGNRTDSMAFGTDYSSRVSSRFENGTWSTPNGTGNAGEFIIIKSNIAGEYSDNTTVHGFAISGTATFDYTASSKDSIVRHYSLDANGSWTRAGNNTYHGDIDVTFDRLYVRENVPYTRTPCITEVSGSGTINGNISVVHKHVIKFHGDLTYNTTGPDRIVTTGSAYFTDTDEYHSGYEGNGTWSRPGADGLPFTGTMSESGNSDHSFAYRFDYQFQPGDLFQSDTWKLTGGTANVTQTVTARFDADASHTSVTVDDSTETSSQGVAIYYVGFNLEDSQSTSFNDTGNSTGSLTTVTRHSTTTVTEEESFHIRASTRLTQNGTLVKDSDNAWGWNTTGNATSTTSGDWLLGTTTGFNGTATTVWSKNDASLTATSTLDSQSGDVKRGEWQADNTFEFIDGLWTQTGSNLTTKVNYDQFANACGTSNLTATGESVSLEMSASRTDNSTLSAYYRHTVTNSGDVTVWGHNGTSAVDWTTSANLTSGSAYLANSEFFNSNFSDSLTTNSTWSQTNNGPILGYNDATYTLASNYSGGSSSDYGGSYAYSGGQNWTWSDPNLSTYDARALSEFRITPAGPPEVGPVTFRSAPNFPFNTSPALVEDAEATAAADQAQSWEDWLIDQGIGFIPIVGSARDAYQAYMSGNNLILVSSLAMLGVDVLTLGGGTAAKVMVKSSLKAGKKTMAAAKGVFKSSADDAVKLVGKNTDNVVKNLDNVAGGAKQISGEVTEVCQKYPGCFAAGTPIQTPLGSKPIDEFVPGDWVLAQDESDPDAGTTIRQVEEVFENQAQVMVLGLGGREIETTPEHPFWVRDKGWTPAGDIEPGDELKSHDGQWIPLDSKQLTDNIVTVYNMRVAEDHTYFVGSPLWGFTVWAHNTCVLGGTYGDVRKANIGGEVHHMPAASINGMSYNKGPAIWMEVSDHRLTSSWGRRGAQFRADQKALIDAGNLRAAVEMDIQDIRRLFNSKYDDGIDQMLKSFGWS